MAFILRRVYPHSYKTVERIIADAWHPNSFKSQVNQTVQIIEPDLSPGWLSIDIQYYDGLVSEIPAVLQKKRCEDLIIDGSKWIIRLKPNQKIDIAQL